LQPDGTVVLCLAFVNCLRIFTVASRSQSWNDLDAKSAAVLLACIPSTAFCGSGSVIASYLISLSTGTVFSRALHLSHTLHFDLIPLTSSLCCCRNLMLLLLLSQILKTGPLAT
jgi:hypothetical protein